MALRGIALTADSSYAGSRDFNFSTHALGDLIRTKLYGLKADRIKKISIELLASPESELTPSTQELLDVLVVRDRFDFKTYWEASPLERRKLLGEKSCLILTEIAVSRDWDVASIQAAFDDMRAEEFRNRRYWKRPIANQSRTMTAQLMIDFDEHRINLSAEVARRGGESLSLPLARLEPIDALLDDALGKFEWKDDRTVQLVSRSDDRAWQASVLQSIR